jgi:hypothetical protein
MAQAELRRQVLPGLAGCGVGRHADADRYAVGRVAAAPGPGDSAGPVRERRARARPSSNSPTRPSRCCVSRYAPTWPHAASPRRPRARCR